MITYKLHLIRHGQIAENLKGAYIGATDSPLSDEGAEKLASLADILEYPHVEKVYSSPLLRCTQTADILYPNTLVEKVPDMSEYNFGDFEGRTFAELKDNEEFMRWIEGKEGAEVPNGEASADFAARIENGIDFILNDMMKNRVTSAALVTHGGVIMQLLSRFGYPKQEPRDWVTSFGEGYTVTVTPQFWMRDRIFEVSGIVPFARTDDEGFSYSEEIDDYDWRADV